MKEDREVYWGKLIIHAELSKKFNEEQLEQLQMIFDCGWEAYRKYLNENHLVVSDLDSLEFLNKSEVNSIKNCLGIGETKTNILLPTSSPFMINVYDAHELQDALDLYRSYDDE
tara:strand:+ start:199 stop:540 length:342 start_codon:yes stop_codon:yes gene_type:complete